MVGRVDVLSPKQGVELALPVTWAVGGGPREDDIVRSSSIGLEGRTGGPTAGSAGADVQTVGFLRAVLSFSLLSLSPSPPTPTLSWAWDGDSKSGAEGAASDLQPLISP